MSNLSGPRNSVTRSSRKNPTSWIRSNTCAIRPTRQAISKATSSRRSQRRARAVKSTSTLNRRVPRSFMCRFTNLSSMARGGTQAIPRTTGEHLWEERSYQVSFGGRVWPLPHQFGAGVTSTGAVATSISTSTNTIGSTSTGRRSRRTVGSTTPTIAAASNITTTTCDSGIPRMTFEAARISGSTIAATAASKC